MADYVEFLDTKHYGLQPQTDLTAIAGEFGLRWNAVGNTHAVRGEDGMWRSQAQVKAEGYFFENLATSFAGWQQEFPHYAGLVNIVEVAISWGAVGGMIPTYCTYISSEALATIATWPQEEKDAFKAALSELSHPSKDYGRIEESGYPPPLEPKWGSGTGLGRGSLNEDGSLRQHHGYEDNSHRPVGGRYEDAGKPPQHHGYEDNSHRPKGRW